MKNNFTKQFIYLNLQLFFERSQISLFCRILNLLFSYIWRTRAANGTTSSKAAYHYTAPQQAALNQAAQHEAAFHQSGAPPICATTS